MNKLKELRKSRNITQSEMSKMFGINQNTYSYLENGKIKIDNLSLEKLANYFNVSIDYLLCRTSDTDAGEMYNDTVNIYKKLRLAKNVSQNEIANALFVTQSAVSKWEKEESIPDATMLPKIADYFGVTVDYLLGRIDTPTASELHIPDNLKSVPIAFSGIEDLTQNDLDEISKFVDYIKSKKNKQR